MKTRIRRTALTLAGSSLLLATATAFAQSTTSPPPPPPPSQKTPDFSATPERQNHLPGHGQDVPSFAELDKANRGRLARKDIPRDNPKLVQLRLHFRDVDLDRDGWLTRDEYDLFVER